MIYQMVVGTLTVVIALFVLIYVGGATGNEALLAEYWDAFKLFLAAGSFAAIVGLMSRLRE